MGWLLFEVVEITNWGARLPQNRFGWRWLLFEELWTPSLLGFSDRKMSALCRLWYYHKLPPPWRLFFTDNQAHVQHNKKKSSFFLPPNLKRNNKSSISSFPSALSTLGLPRRSLILRSVYVQGEEGAGVSTFLQTLT